MNIYRKLKWFIVFDTGYLGLRWLDKKLIRWNSEATPYLRGLWEERTIYMREAKTLQEIHGDDWFEHQPEESAQRWRFINCESDRLFPKRYVDIRRVFKFLYYDRKVLDRDERIRQAKALSEVAKRIMNENSNGGK